MAVHGVIEFGNRLLAIALGVIVLALFVAAVLHRPRRAPVVWLSLWVALSIPAQAVIGGLTVLTGLNPWLVAAHFLFSMAIIAVTVALWRRVTETTDSPSRPLVRTELLWLGRTLVGVTAVVLAFGTIVTGSGPHAGDRTAPRTGFDPATVTQLHADAVMLLIGLSVGTWVALHIAKAPREITQAAALLIGVELAQGIIGYTQYFTHLPVLLVGFHLLGACLVWIAALRVLLLMRIRSKAPAADGEKAEDQNQASIKAVSV